MWPCWSRMAWKSAAHEGAVLGHFAAAHVRRAAEQHARVSSPQRNEPPAVVKTLQWMPRPSIRTALGIGVVAAAAFAAVSRRVA